MKCFFCGKQDKESLLKLRLWAPVKAIRNHLAIVEYAMHEQLERVKGDFATISVSGGTSPACDVLHASFCTTIAKAAMTDSHVVTALLKQLNAMKMDIGISGRRLPRKVRCHTRCWRAYEKEVGVQLRDAAFKLVPLQKRIDEEGGGDLFACQIKKFTRNASDVKRLERQRAQSAKWRNSCEQDDE